ncbi:hypothetical protein [Algoriphagus antarcticus]|uniref:Uncharacterized protein n=1 Tax=Algoriphagus antarcticus TaxID=238540 RepID=A0A3E0D7R8_9BACT|nr:hypothetical protein [Algoriphagus antarcticus]REG77618.1 hypothetical protein C8N25_14032 [Algoriphagus antarcticus]
MPTLNAVCYIYLTLRDAFAQTDTVVYIPTNKLKQYKIAGKASMGITIIGTIPIPRCHFAKSDYAVIYVTNEMKLAH